MIRSLIPLALAACLGLGTARASEVYAGTTGPHARVLRYDSGTTWVDISPPVELTSVWDLEWFDGRLWACGQQRVPGTGPQGLVASWDGAAWTEVEPPGQGIFFGLVVQQGELYVGAITAVGAEGLWRWNGSGFDSIPGLPHLLGRETADPCSPDGRIYFGEDFLDRFAVYDPLGSLGPGPGCLLATPPFAGAGCYGGSCVHSMTMHDAGAGPTAHAGAYHGALYEWSEPAASFVPRPAIPGTGHVQGLASFRGRLLAGTSEGTLHDVSDPSVPYVLVGDFTRDVPVSALAADVERDVLWIGHGAVPFLLARGDGLSMVRTWDGSSFVDRSAPDAMDRGVVSLLVVPDGFDEDAVIDCLWPPNHRMVTIRREDVAGGLASACGVTTSWHFATCTSNQPDDTTGDGHFAPDCVVSPDGASVQVRAERRGDVREPRVYELGVLGDGAPPGAVPTIAGVVIVPHDVRGCR